MSEYPEEIVSIGDSQLLRFIDEINGVIDCKDEIYKIKTKINRTKKKKKSLENKIIIRELYKKLYELQFVKDYVCVVMDKPSDYDRANQGFKINGIKYRRFLGTNGGIKTSTIVYVNEELYPELKHRLDNGRNMDKELVPAKLEAYQALICSASTPLPPPKGIIVVKDCITHFKDDVILIDDSNDGEPVLTYQDKYEIEHNDSDGYGLMLPSYSCRVNEALNGDPNKTISGMNTRYAWTKGMVYTFDYIEFAEKIAGTYEIVDAWGDKRDVRDAEVIITVSMLKLWDSYESWEDYYENCEENHYQFSTPKLTPDELEPVRNTNYQFLQSYEFSDEELMELCKPTIDEIKDTIGLDYRKSLAYLTGENLNADSAFGDHIDYCAKALMAEPEMINDPFIRKKIWGMISKRIDMAKKGSIQINANFAMISGDPYALCQCMFGIPVTGLMRSGEVYHKYWIDKGATEISCFRAPMTCHNNIRKRRLCNTDEARYWYRYITTAMILNAWDTTCDAENGADFDGDSFYTTDNAVIINNTRDTRTIICIQRKASKIVPSEQDIIESNKLAFNDEIGIVTNHVTSMIERQAGFDKDSEEYKTLEYRIMTGQNYQQNCIDRAKGIIAKSMPEYWYNQRSNIIRDEDDLETRKKKDLNSRISAAKKPYFMIYVYPHLKKELRDWRAAGDYNAMLRFGDRGITCIQDIIDCSDRTDEMDDYLSFYYKGIPVGENKCVVNRMAWMFENEFDGYMSKDAPNTDFDYRIMKSDIGYSKQTYSSILSIYKDYKKKITSKAIDKNYNKNGKVSTEILTEMFKADCEIACSNKYELCDIVLDICYQTEGSKQFAWDVCGDTIIENLINRNGGLIHYPECVSENGEFVFRGRQYVIAEKDMKEVTYFDSIE